MKLKDITTTTTLHNGIQMPVLGLGVYKAKNGEEVINSVHHALEAGYRHIDTAAFYNNEEGVGEAIRNTDIPREEIFITTKVWNDDQGYLSTLNAFESSINKLGLDYIDLYLIHWPVSGKYPETWKALEKLYKDGRVKAIGVCNFLIHHLESIAEKGGIKPMVLQNEFHPRLIQQPILDYCKVKNIQLESWSPLMRGRILKDETIMRLSEKHRKTAAQVVIRWHLQKGVATIPKSVHKDRIIENVNIFDFELTEEDMVLIESMDRGERTGAHPDDFTDHFRKIKF